MGDWPIGTALGIDIGGTSVKASLVRDGAVLARGRSDPYRRPATGELVHAIHQATRLEGLTHAARIDAVGLCCPGVLDEATQQITLAVNVPGLVGVPLRELVRRGVHGDHHGGPDSATHADLPLPPPVVVGDGFAATYDVWCTRRDLEPALRRRMLSLVLGTGVGGCVLDDGKPLHVSGRSPGHLGQIDVGIEDQAGEIPRGPDGGRGGLEAYLGLPALIKNYGDATPPADGGPSELARSIARWTPKDPPMRALSRALRIGHALYRPDTVYLLGGVAMMLAPVIDVLKVMVATELTSLARPGWTIRLGEHAWHAADGAARAAGAA